MSVDLKPPATVRAAFARGVALYEAGRGGDGLVPSTIAWARRLAAGDPATPAKARKGNAWHARHAVDERTGWGTPGSETHGYVAYMLWGGAPGRAWFGRLVRQLDAADNANESATGVGARSAGHDDSADEARQEQTMTAKNNHRRDSIHAIIAAVEAAKATEATFPIREGESISDFADRLSDAASTWAESMLSEAAIAAGYDPTLEDMGVEDPDFGAYVPRDGVHAETLVICVRRDHPYMRLDLRAKYSRAEDGTFTFSPDVTVVEGRTVYDDVQDGPAKLAAFVSVEMPGAEAVESPTMAQRRNLPASAYAAPFYADDAGNYNPGSQKFMRSKSALPFHINTAQSVTSTDTVDVPRLRAALSRFAQTDWARFGQYADTVKAKARRVLDAAAKALLPSAKAAASVGESACARMVGAPSVADVAALVAAYEVFRRETLPDRIGEACADIVSTVGAKPGKPPVTATRLAELQRSAAALAVEAADAKLSDGMTNKLLVLSQDMAAGAFHAIGARG